MVMNTKQGVRRVIFEENAGPGTPTVRVYQTGTFDPDTEKVEWGLAQVELVAPDAFGSPVTLRLSHPNMFAGQMAAAIRIMNEREREVMS